MVDAQRQGEAGVPRETESSGNTAMGLPGIASILAYLIVVAFLVLYGLIALWPPNPKAQNDTENQETGNQPGQSAAAASLASAPNPPLTAAEKLEIQAAARHRRLCESYQQEPAFYLGAKFCISPEERLLLIVLLAGALGGVVHAFRSLYWYTGNRKMVWSWAAMYLVLPILGGAMAFIFYLVIRGGFFSPTARIEDTSSFGFAAVAVLVGMFTREAAEKLKQISETVFTKPGAGKDHVSATPTVIKLEPDQGALAGGTEVTITGSGFVPETQVSFGGQAAAKVRFVSETSLVATTPKGNAAESVPVEVINPGNQKDSSKTFKYVADTP